MSLSLKTFLNGLSIRRDARTLGSVLGSVLTDLTAFKTAAGTASSSLIYNSGALAISSTKPKVATANTIYGMAAGVPFAKAAADMAALSGTVTHAKFNVFCFYVTSAGTLSSAMGTEGAALINVVFPTQAASTAMIGFVIINPTGTGNFVGGTTDLDHATVVPNAVYVDTIGANNPGINITLNTVS